MNQFQSIQSGQGLLKNDYVSGDTALGAALKKKRKKLAQTKGMEAKDGNESTGISSEFNNSTNMP